MKALALALLLSACGGGESCAIDRAAMLQRLAELRGAPLEWSDTLAQAAQAHADDMARHGFASHVGSDGSTAAGRAQAQGWPSRYVGEPAQGCELAGFEYCNWYWPSNWYDIDLTGRYLGRRECFLDNGAGGAVNVSTNVNHPNRTPDGWAGPTYTTGTRPVVVP